MGEEDRDYTYGLSDARENRAGWNMGTLRENGDVSCRRGAHWAVLCLGNPSSISPRDFSALYTTVTGVLQKANPDVQIGQNRAEADKLHKRYVLHTGSSSHFSHSRNNFSFRRLQMELF